MPQATETDARTTAERERLRTNGKAWRTWGPYVSERAWGTVREDYSAGGTAWEYVSHDVARSRAYRWSEDGIAGICDDQQRALSRPRAVERSRSDSQGAPLRSHRQRGQPRGGRQGVLLLPRLHARRTPT